MRIIIAVFIWIVIIGSVCWFQQRRSTSQNILQEHPQAAVEVTQDRYSIAVTPTFQAQPDPFALQTEDTAPAALIIRMGEKELLRCDDQVQAGQAITVDIPGPIQLGTHEIYIEGSPPLDQGQQRQAILVELFRNNVWIKQASFWSTPGSNVTGVLYFEIKEELDHDARGESI